MDNQLLEEVVSAWESLEGDCLYTPNEISEWLIDDMKPVMDKIRNHLKKESDNG